jgi:hypothetical protein
MDFHLKAVNIKTYKFNSAQQEINEKLQSA